MDHQNTTLPTTGVYPTETSPVSTLAISQHTFHNQSATMSWMTILSAWLPGAAGVTLLILVFAQRLFETQTKKEIAVLEKEARLAELACKERIAALEKEVRKQAHETRLAELASKERIAVLAQEICLADLATKERIAVMAKEECEMAKAVRLAELAYEERMQKEALASERRIAVRKMEKDVFLARLAHNSPEAPASLAITPPPTHLAPLTMPKAPASLPPHCA
ncbi:hypothetical protein B0T25DRAFT_597235 [Lasiosphaeria hispida]|uniref:Uncharacterized protein n=1 Tax=Lasiosphaeria hispida TaxID=260671 RepID=A0AAJ0HVR4_9PEZI|nr:hypothetical protein B0T25DRAFT_597235 [Lasiosphaeria hispida]